MSTPLKVAFQGEPGANSHIAATKVFPAAEAVPLPTFEDCFAAVETSSADYAMIPIENSVAGRVADIHTLLPMAQVVFVGEFFLPVHHQLMALPGVGLDKIETVHSHVQALGQCRARLRALGLTPMVSGDTAGAARDVARTGDPTQAAIASSLAAQIYGLDILMSDLEDETHNTTRFVVVAREAQEVRRDRPAMTSILFRVRNIPASLYKAMGGFATNGVNMVKLESYQTGGLFYATMFYADVEGHRDDEHVARALEELRFYSQEMRIVGTYEASPFRETQRQRAERDINKRLLGA